MWLDTAAFCSSTVCQEVTVILSLHVEGFILDSIVI